ncbi:hypothetical protein, partial [Rheinheimera sp.]|uniref:hypothetical protein n=1 Tax=Rheinheimera sp. TaxID=1869214 RepID=UPI0027B9C07A
LAKITALNFDGANSLFRLEIDQTQIEISDFISDSIGLSRFTWQLTFRKESFLRSINQISDDIDVVFFTSEPAFLENLDAIGLKTPFLESKILSIKPLKIIINGLANGFGGPRLAVVPVEGVPDEKFWLNGTELPDPASLRKEINVVSQTNIYLSPHSFEISWGAINTDTALPFRIAYLQQLLACFSQHFFSIEKIQLKGVKHLECSLVPNSEFNIFSKELNDIRDAVIWCYKENDASTRIQLLVDRITLELTDSCNFVNIASSKLSPSFEQAKSKYKYVVSKRNEDYRKELRELYSDVKQLVNSYVDKTNTMIDGIIKDVLSIAFLFTVGTFAKAMIQTDILLSTQADFFFKAAGVYLIFTYLIRRIHCYFVLSDNKKNLDGWISEQYTHIPVTELTDKVGKLLRSPRRSFEIMSGIIATIHIILVILAFNMSQVLELIGFTK